MANKTISAKTLGSYARALGRNSMAATCLRDYTEARASGLAARIEMTNNGFRLVLTEKTGPDGNPLARRYG